MDAPTRHAWIDTLKIALVCLIIVIHGVLGYAGTVEVWTYTEFREVTLHPVTEGVLFVLVAPFGLLVIPLLFLVSGLVTPGSVERRGPARYARGRLLRLGVPFAVFVFVLQPALTYALALAVGVGAGAWAEEYLGEERRLDSGPAWFVGVLLLFSLGYAAWAGARASGRGRRRAPGAPPTDGRRAPAPLTAGRLLGIAALVAAASIVVRLAYPFGSEAGFTDLNLWEWPACLAAFAVGVAASGQGWLDAVPPDLARRCRAVTWVAGAAMAALLVAAGMADRIAALLGGWNPYAVAFALVEAPLAICGPVWLAALAQRRLGGGFRGDAALARTSYAAFMVQGIPLIGLAVALRPVAVPAEVKALVVAIGGLVGSFALAGLLVRLPGVRRAL